MPTIELARQPRDKELELDVELADGEPQPDAGALQALDAAGVHFKVKAASVAGRSVHLEVVRRS